MFCCVATMTDARSLSTGPQCTSALSPISIRRFVQVLYLRDLMWGLRWAPYLFRAVDNSLHKDFV